MQCHPLINILHYTAPSGNTSCGSPQLLVSRPAYALNGRQGLAPRASWRAEDSSDDSPYPNVHFAMRTPLLASPRTVEPQYGVASAANPTSSHPFTSALVPDCRPSSPRSRRRSRSDPNTEARSRATACRSAAAANSSLMRACSWSSMLLMKSPPARPKKVAARRIQYADCSRDERVRQVGVACNCSRKWASNIGSAAAHPPCESSPVNCCETWSSCSSERTIHTRYTSTALNE
eukprot:scaffold39973_cov30-Tisochrysis_lutea.AAC.1